jgi:hypothetical protein
VRQSLSRGQYLDPDSRDLFVILVPQLNGRLASVASPLQFVSNPVSQGGLGITVHLISQDQVLGTDRKVTPTQNAVRVTESLTTSDPNILGFSNTGTPNGLDLATIYTQNILNHLATVYGGLAKVPAGLADTYIKHTIAHEVGHMLGPLAPAYDSRFGGYHYKSGTNVMMDQSVYYTSKAGKVTFYIGTAYTSLDQASSKLR